MLLFEEVTSAASDATSEASEAAAQEFDWNAFWRAIGDFFVKDDGTGIGAGYLVRIGLAIAIIIIAYFFIKFIIFILRKAMGIKKNLELDVSAKWFATNILKIMLWIAVAFLVTGILNINMTGFAGVASAITVALGLALQDVIGCWASGIIILHQKHIRTGDFIHIKNGLGECEGTVVRINFLMTYLKTPNGQEVTIPNNNVQKAIVTNFTKLGKRRINFDVGVAYNTDIEKAKKALLSVLEGDKRVLPKEDCTAYVYELGSYSVGLRLRFWTKVADYWPVYNELSEKVLIAFRKNKIYIPSSTDIAVTNKK